MQDERQGSATDASPNSGSIASNALTQPGSGSRSTSPFSAQPSRSSAADSTSDPTTDASNSGAISGDRVAWLYGDGNGFARKGDMWVYHGPRAVLAGSPADAQAPVELALYETMRTNSFVELFDKANAVRIRLYAKEARSFALWRSARSTIRGGNWHDSTGPAIGWSAGMTLPANRVSYTPVASGTQDLPDLIAAIEKQVARIDVRTKAGFVNGSGFLVDPSGRMVTNYHVVEGSNAAQAVFKDPKTNAEIKAPIVGFLHADPLRDIAVLQAKLPPNFNYAGLELATEPRKGDSVVAFGAPLGLDSTASEGIISGFRSAAELKSTLGVEPYAGNWIQTTTPISPGNSGGPLVNRSGEVVAINTMTLNVGQQLNFAISATDIKRAIASSVPAPRPLSPAALPIKRQRLAGGPPSAGGPGGRRTGPRIRVGRVDLFPIEDLPEAATHLAQLDDLLVEIFTNEQILATAIREEARDALKKAGVNVVIDEGSVMLIIAELKPATKNTYNLELAAHLYVVSGGDLLRIWRESEDLGRISKTAIRRGSVGGKTKATLGKFFGKLRTDIDQAKAAQTTGDSSSDDPFKDR